jgi:hypothetical protein
MFRVHITIIAVATWIRKLIATAIHGASYSASARSQRLIPAREPRASPQRIKSRDGGKVAIILVCICLGLVSVGGVIGAVLIGQIRGLKAGLAQTSQDLAATKARLNQLEKVARRTEVEATANHAAAKTQRERAPLILSVSDIQIIRESIRMAPPQTGAQSKIKVGDEVPELAARLVPESLVVAVPKLQGARFSIDQSGAIIIIGVGANFVDAVIAYR